MAILKCTLFFLLGVLVSPAYLQEQPCSLIKNTVPRGFYILKVEPLFYRPGAIYTVSITGVENGTSVILHAVTSQHNVPGLWESDNQLISCSGDESLVKKNISGSSIRTRWTSPTNTNVLSAEIRTFVSFANGTTLMQTQTLTKEFATASVTAVPSSASHTAAVPHQPTLRSNATDAHVLLNSTVIHHHNLASAHESTKGTGGPKGSVSTAQASSFILAATQLLSAFLGFKLLS
ncbi:placenta-expressed transcript 1 protein-like [Hemicordylus capensis]|uniref:placenta-expressed transcript 1 protein-like n=1 Tax=Hemicordylus capensis TaxID=884348 RepID=UPI0023032A8C|nr:placenta-expressed transcript 1 protein-like [Hemicordylus capensis]